MQTPAPLRARPHTTTSLTLVTAAAGCLMLQLFVLPLWLLPRTGVAAWLLVPLVALSIPLWSVLHEAIHGSLLADRRSNDRLGRMLAVGYGAPFILLKTGHLLHHRYSRTQRERTEIFDPSHTTWLARAPGYYLRLFGGLYLAEVATVGLAAVPAAGWRRVARRLDAPDTVTGMLLTTVRRRHLREFRVDAAATVALYTASAVAYGRHAWLLVAAVAGRAVLVSLADNAYHYGTRLDAPLEAMNLALPRPLETFVLAFNLHSVHHRHPGLPWHQLRRAFVADEDRFHLGWFAAVARQARGPIPVTALRDRPPDS
ncbi:fatty acid desaturase [Micromonospora sp. WMMD812]|uniref:fatty acid desaturase family protein n=1 Tax=Micromonospora sp. WMMD812 TaxID=3015152 RepID=UPI00248C3590|nr:fatty acid desaturase [Micromonospora sp. WMMD812]WBB70763.1 fatty acid desaturase [Micromonospora sp. WMMD812]